MALLKHWHAFWTEYRPPRRRDIRLLLPDFETIEAMNVERAARARLQARGGRKDVEIGDHLRSYADGAPADITCCPLAVREFRIWVIGQGLKLLRPFDEAWELHVFEPTDDVRFGQLDQVNWRQLDMRDRRRIERRLSPDALVYGGNEVQAHYASRTWRVHRHLFIANCTRQQIERFRDAYYRPRDGRRGLLQVEDFANRPRQMAYALKLNAFRRPFPQTSGWRPPPKRLRPPEHAEFLRYLARHSPTDFLFVMNATRRKGRHFEQNIGRDVRAVSGK